MAKNPDSTRKFLQNIRTPKPNNEIEPILSSTIAAGEIAVQMGSGDTTDESKVTTGLWTLAADGITPVRFPSEARVQAMISSGAVLEVDKIETAVGLTENGELPSDWKDNTEFITSSTSVIDAVQDLDHALTTVSGNIQSTILALNATSVADENKVVTDVTQTDGKITATASNITGVKLGGYTEGTDADIAATDTLGEALGKLQAQINAMDKTANVVAGQVVTTVAEEDGKVTETKASVKDLQLGGYSKDSSATGDIASTDTINTALSKLENTVAANKISNADGSINVITATTGTDINVNIKSNEHVLAKDGNEGLYTNIKISGVTPSSETVKEEFKLFGTDGTQLGDSIKIYKDSHIVSIDYVESSQTLEYKYIDAEGNTQTTDIDMSELVLEAEFASGVGITNHVAHGVVDPASEKDSNNDSFLTVGADGFKVDGIKDEIDAKIAALDKTDDAAVAGQYVAAIEETDGVVAVKTRANVSEAVLNNYTKGSDATAVAPADTVNQAISKLENQVDKAKAAATTKVVEGVENEHLAITSATSTSDSSVTYTVTLTDVASQEDVNEIAGFVGLGGTEKNRTYSHDSSNYLPSSNNTVKGDIETIDSILGKVESTPASSADTVFSSENTVAKSISDIKKDIAAFKDKLNVVDDAKYIVAELTKTNGTFTIGVSALTQSVSAATSTTSALVDSWDAKVNLVHEIVDNTTGANTFNVTKTEATNNNSGVVYDFTNLVVDCGTF